MKLMFEISKPGRRQELIPGCDVEKYEFEEKYLRNKPARLPQLSEVELDRHYSRLAKQVHGVNDLAFFMFRCAKIFG